MHNGINANIGQSETRKLRIGGHTLEIVFPLAEIVDGVFRHGKTQTVETDIQNYYPPGFGQRGHGNKYPSGNMHC